MQLADGNRWRMPGTCSTCGAERCLPGTFQQEAAYRQKGSVGGTQLTIVAGGPLATAASSTPSVAHDPRSMVQPPLCAVGGGSDIVVSAARSSASSPILGQGGYAVAGIPHMGDAVAGPPSAAFAPAASSPRSSMRHATIVGGIPQPVRTCVGPGGGFRYAPADYSASSPQPST